MGDGIPDAQPGQPGPLAEGPQHHQVRVAGDERDHRFAAELHVCLVHHNDRFERTERLEFRTVHGVAGRVVRRRQEDDARAVMDRVADGDHIEVEVRPPRHFHRFCSRNLREEAVHAERGRRDHHGPRHHEPDEYVDEVVGAGASHHHGRFDPEPAGDRLAQAVLPRVRVDVEGGAFNRAEDLRVRPVQVLVCVQLHEPVDGQADFGGQHIERLDRHILLEGVEVGTK